MDPDRPVVRWTLIVIWLLVAVMLYEPIAAFLASPLFVVAFISGVAWTVQDVSALRHQSEMIVRGHRWVRAELSVLVVLAGVCVALATTLSMRQRGYPYALSTGLAPSLLSIVLVAALAALRRPSPRRLALASLAVLGVYPLLAIVQMLSVPLFGEDFAITSPRVMQGYTVVVLVIAGLGIHLGIVARSHGLGDEIPAPPPRASI